MRILKNYVLVMMGFIGERYITPLPQPEQFVFGILLFVIMVVFSKEAK